MTASDAEVDAAAASGLKKDKKKKHHDKDKEHKKDKKRSEADGIHKDKKDKKKEKAAQEKLARALDAHLQAEVAAGAADETKAAARREKSSKREKRASGRDGEEGDEAPEGALVYFAYPMADEKTHKKIFKLVKKGAKLRAIHRGVKECEKAIKKAPVRQLNVETAANVPFLLVIAGDISPPEVIEHFPVHCEEHNVPYLFVRSRADLGVAACTKRATSVVLVRPEGKGPAPPRKQKAAAADGEDDGAEADDKEAAGGGKVDPAEFREAWTELVKLAQKEYGAQVMPFIQREKRGY